MERRDDEMDKFEVVTRNYAPQTDIEVRVDRRDNYPLVEVLAVKKPSAKRAPRGKRGRSETPRVELVRFRSPSPLPLVPRREESIRSSSGRREEQQGPPRLVRNRIFDRGHYAVPAPLIDNGEGIISGPNFRFEPPLTDAEYKKAVGTLMAYPPDFEREGKVGPWQVVNAIENDERYDEVVEELSQVPLPFVTEQSGTGLRFGDEVHYAMPLPPGEGRRGIRAYRFDPPLSDAEFEKAIEALMDHKFDLEPRELWYALQNDERYDNNLNDLLFNYPAPRLLY